MQCVTRFILEIHSVSASRHGIQIVAPRLDDPRSALYGPIKAFICVSLSVAPLPLLP